MEKDKYKKLDAFGILRKSLHRTSKQSYAVEMYYKFCVKQQTDVLLHAKLHEFTVIKANETHIFVQCDQ